METQKDFEDLLRLLNKHKVRYCIIGAYAVAFYARPRYTKDLDVFIAADINNGKQIMEALREFGFESLDLSANDFTKKGEIVQLGYEPIRIDFLTSIEGCSFDEVWKHKKEGQYGEEKVYFISKEDLIKNKKATKRKQDQVDLDLLKD